jgi:hypothetical protein
MLLCFKTIQVYRGGESLPGGLKQTSRPAKWVVSKNIASAPMLLNNLIYDN